ncbi:hypothetical protein E4K10_34985 [Streptomyces sp. T1317-0309]|nr:hypothetical protein E4K10_34985 [Streptomyces sp. T1317-0309]
MAVTFVPPAPVGSGVSGGECCGWGRSNGTSCPSAGRFAWRSAWRPLVVGVVTHHLDDGAFAALGALPAGFASFEGRARTRVAAVVAASTGMAVSTFVGGYWPARPPGCWCPWWPCGGTRPGCRSAWACG